MLLKQIVQLSPTLGVADLEPRFFSDELSCKVCSTSTSDVLRPQAHVWSADPVKNSS